MTKLEEVLAEEWFTDDGEIGDGAEPNQRMLCRFQGTQALAEARAAVAVLGKRALALVLKHEWHTEQDGRDDDGYDTYDEYCAECGNPQSKGHKEGCEWGSICDEARRLG